MRHTLLFVLVLLLVSCQKEKPLTTQEMILGSWKAVDTTTSEDYRHRYGDLRGFDFLNDSVCDYKLGYFYFDLKEYHNYKVDENYKQPNDFVKYLGTRTSYSISKDTFKIFDKGEEKKELIYHVLKFTKDTLILEDYDSEDKDILTLVKQNYEINKQHQFDGVIVSGSHCFGSCPISNILIEATGDVKYLGIDYVGAKGFKTSKITREQFNEIATLFYKADYFNMKNYYYAEVTDNQTVSIAFLKDGKIIKSIRDYASSAPTELIWAYRPVQFLNQQLKFTEWKVPDYMTFKYFLYATLSDKRNNRLYLTSAESFYLISTLIEGKEVDKVFEEKYRFDFGNKDIQNIFTDGRFFKFKFKNKDTKIIDIGFNFLESSNLVDTFEKTK